LGKAKEGKVRMRKIAISLSKGGTGKTTTAVNLAAGLALKGYRVLLVDFDTQGQVTQALGLNPGLGLADVVADRATANEAIIEGRERLHVLAGGHELAGVKRLIARKDFGAELTVSDALEGLNGRFDFVILDTAPGWDSLTINALFYANEVLTPVSLEVLALQGLARFQKSLKRVQKYHDRLRLRYVLPTFLDRRVSKSEEILAQLDRYYPELLLPAIRYNVRLSEAPGHGETIFEYAPRSAGAQDYAELTERIAGDD
jgi:chromosome partitioning protein